MTYSTRLLREIKDLACLRLVRRKDIKMFVVHYTVSDGKDVYEREFVCNESQARRLVERLREGGNVDARCKRLGWFQRVIRNIQKRGK